MPDGRGRIGKMLVTPRGRRLGIVEIIEAGTPLRYALKDSLVCTWAGSHEGVEVVYQWEEDVKAGRIIVAFAVSQPTEGPEEPASESQPSSPQELTQAAESAAPSRTDSALPYLLFDQADDEAVVARLKGLAVQSYVYHFTQKGQDVYGLGVDGAEACKRELARGGEVIEEEDVQIEKEDVGAAYFKAYASRWAVSRTGNRIKLDTAIGTKRQAKQYESGQDNPFWFEQGCSKAIRNAILRLTPEEIKLRLIETYKTTAKTVVPSRPGGFIRRR